MKPKIALIFYLSTLATYGGVGVADGEANKDNIGRMSAFSLSEDQVSIASQDSGVLGGTSKFGLFNSLLMMRSGPDLKNGISRPSSLADFDYDKWNLDGVYFSKRLLNTVSYSGQDSAAVSMKNFSDMWRLHSIAYQSKNSLIEETFYQGDAAFYGLVQNQRIIEQNDKLANQNEQIISLLTKIASNTVVGRKKEGK